MKLVYVISRHTTPNSNHRLHIPNPYNQDMPMCGAKSFTIEHTDTPLPTCKKCLKLLEECMVYLLYEEEW